MIVYLSLLVAIVGLIMYFVASNPKVQEVGKIMLFSGLLAFLIMVGSHMIGAAR
jgi:hypothetical protein